MIPLPTSSSSHPNKHLLARPSVITNKKQRTTIDSDGNDKENTQSTLFTGSQILNNDQDVHDSAMSAGKRQKCDATNIDSGLFTAGASTSFRGMPSNLGEVITHCDLGPHIFINNLSRTMVRCTMSSINHIMRSNIIKTSGNRTNRSLHLPVLVTKDNFSSVIEQLGRQQQYCAIREIILDNTLDVTQIEQLKLSLHNVTSITISNLEHMRLLVEYLPSNLSELSVTGCDGIGDDATLLEKLGNKLYAMKGLQALDLYQNDIVIGEHLITQFPCSIRTLVLSRNTINDGTAAVLVKELPRFINLTNVYLAECFVGLEDEKLDVLGDVVKALPSMVEELNLEGNVISDETKKSLRAKMSSKNNFQVVLDDEDTL